MARTGKPQVIAHRTNGEAINHLITEVYLAGRRIRITQDENNGGEILEVESVSTYRSEGVYRSEEP